MSINDSKEDGYSSMIRPRVGMRQHASDFANTFKAFIGSSYLTIPFAFKQSGIAPGLFGIALAVFMTDHCCQLLLRAKQRVTNQLLIEYQEELREPVSIEHIEEIRQKMEKNISYGAIGKMAFGKVGLFLVNIPLFITQFGFCTGYFIFIATTIEACFPLKTISNMTTLNNSISDVAEHYFYEDYYGINMTNVSVPIISISNSSSIVSPTVSTAPSIFLLFLIPFPIFIGFSLMRSIRNMGPASVIANISIIIGYFGVLIYAVTGLTEDGSAQFDWYAIFTFPIFWGQITCSFEGIGTVIPIESSMDGNRHLFSKFLHIVLILISSMLAGFGLIGYLRFGDQIEQTVNVNLPAHTAFAILINITLMLGVLCTFPLQIFPAVALVEGWIFSEGACCGSCNEDEDSDVCRPLTRTATQLKIDEASAAMTVPPFVPSWKRNIVRICIVCLQFGLAVVMRDYFAYFISFIGSLGCSPLAYILPCVFHLKLRKGQLKPVVIAKDIVIIVLGGLGMIAGVYAVLAEIIENSKKSA